MYYYVMETAESGVIYIKTRRAWEDREQATRETDFNVKWIAPCSFGIYLSATIKKFLKKC